MWGLYDTKENCWLGNRNGPLTYYSEELAIIAARCLDIQLGWAAGRIRSRKYDGQAKVLKDELPLKTNTEEALQMLEDGLCL